jgi:hypothetical protein
MSTMRLSWTEQSFASCCPRGSGGLLHSHQRWKQHSERDLFSLGRLIKFQQKTSKNQRGFEDNFSECDNVASDSFAVLENTARKCFLFSWFCIIRSWLMKLHKRRRRQHWFQFAMAASSWFFVEITANFLPQWKASRPTQQGLISLFERLALYGLRPIMLNTQCLGAREELLLYEGPQGSSFSSEPVCQYLYYYFYFFIIYLSIYIYMILWYYTYVYAMHTFFTLADM